MKKMLLILFALWFGYLFHQQTLGLNAILFLPFIIMVVSFNGFRFSWYLASFILTGLAVFINPSFLTVFALFVTLFVFISKTYIPGLSIYLSVFNGAINFLTGGIDSILKSKNESSIKKDVNGKFWLVTTIIVVPVVLLFISLYRNANPVFNNLIESIDLSFINIGFIFTCSLGYFILFNIKRPVLVKEMEEIDEATPNDLALPENNFSGALLKKIQNEHLQASILIGILNVLLIIFLVTDFFLYQDNTAMSSFSNNVHNGVNTLITSILLAIVIISIYFRGNLNFYKDNLLLKRLTYTWLILNSILVLSTCYKNGAYIHYHGLTYKRIGVFIYLLMVVTGLYYTYAKINTKKTIWFVIKKSSIVGFFFFTGLSLIPYSKLVAYYNIKNAKKLDINYLLSLPEDNSVILWEHKDEIKQKIYENISHKLSDKSENYKRALSYKSWQSYCLDYFIYK